MRRSVFYKSPTYFLFTFFHVQCNDVRYIVLKDMTDVDCMLSM